MRRWFKILGSLVSDNASLLSGVHSFDAADMDDGTVITITKDDVRKHMDDILTKIDLKKFIL